MTEILQPGTRQTIDGHPYTTPRPMVPQKLIITDSITMLKRNQYALLRYLGIGEKGEGGRKSGWKFTGNATSILAWLEDEIVTRETTLTAGIDAVVTAIPVVDATLFRSGDVLENGTELMRVTSVDSGVSLTVTREFGGTVAVASLLDDPIVYRTRANQEGSDIIASVEGLPTDEFNVVQNMKDAARVSFASMRISDYGLLDRMTDQIEKKFINLVDGLNNAVYKNDVRVDGQTDAIRMFGGLPYFITEPRGSTVMDLAGAALSYGAVKDALKNVAMQTTEIPTLMVTDAVGVDAVSEWFSGSVRTTVTETRGGVVITRIVTPHGELDVMVDYTMPVGNTYLLNPDYIDVIPADPFGVYEQETQGDSYQRMIHGEYSFLCAASKAHAHLFNYDLS